MDNSGYLLSLNFLPHINKFIENHLFRN